MNAAVFGFWVSTACFLWGGSQRVPDLDRLMGSNRAAMAFVDVPCNVGVRSIGRRGLTEHAEFRHGIRGNEFWRGICRFPCCWARQFQPRIAKRRSPFRFDCDWRHVTDIIEAGRLVYDEVLNIVVWVKSNRLGKVHFIAAKHEFIIVFRVGRGFAFNNIELGRHGRSRSNVWNYAGVNAFRAGRMEELRSHPTAKPVALIADAMRDCTRRGDVVLDTFSGSGTTIMAAERIGRRAYAMEIEPRYVDVAIRRWQAFTRKDAVHAETGRTFDQLTAERSSTPNNPRGRPARQRRPR